MTKGNPRPSLGRATRIPFEGLSPRMQADVRAIVDKWQQDAAAPGCGHDGPFALCVQHPLLVLCKRCILEHLHLDRDRVCGECRGAANWSIAVDLTDWTLRPHRGPSFELALIIGGWPLCVGCLEGVA